MLVHLHFDRSVRATHTRTHVGRTVSGAMIGALVHVMVVPQSMLRHAQERQMGAHSGVRQREPVLCATTPGCLRPRAATRKTGPLFMALAGMMLGTT